MPISLKLGPYRSFTVGVNLYAYQVGPAAHRAVLDILLVIALRVVDWHDDLLAASAANVTSFVVQCFRDVRFLSTEPAPADDCLAYMASSQMTAAETNQRAAEATLAKAIAPEDIRLGDYVSPLHLICEAPSYWWFCDDWNLPRDEPVRIRYIAHCDGAPLRVKSVCLPFVLVKRPGGKTLSLDVRKCQLARLDAKYARRAWKAFKKASANATSSCGTQ